MAELGYSQAEWDRRMAEWQRDPRGGMERSMKTVRVWVPDEAKWGGPRVIARGGRPPHPGRVFDVAVHSRARALEALARFRAGEPNIDKEPAAWLAWREASKVVAQVADCEPVERFVDLEAREVNKDGETVIRAKREKFTGRRARERGARPAPRRGRS